MEKFVSDLSATISPSAYSHRPSVRPSDLSSIRKFMCICACLWGWAYNPRSFPYSEIDSGVAPRVPDSLTGAQIARGYVEFFEPDAFVEAAPNLLETIGLGALRQTTGLRPSVIPLDALLACGRDRDWSEFSWTLASWMC